MNELEMDKLKITLKAARVNKGMTQAKAAEVLGKSVDVIKSLESGKREILHSELLNLCKAYDWPIDNIFLPIKSPKSEFFKKMRR